MKNIDYYPHNGYEIKRIESIKKNADLWKKLLHLVNRPPVTLISVKPHHLDEKSLFNF